MQVRFLCTKHRSSLESEPDEALKCCATYCERGWQLYKQQRWEDALPYMGCAFETAFIVLSSKALASADAREWFMHTLVGLTQTLIKLEQLELCAYLYQSSMDLLRKEPADSLASKSSITLQINQLARELRHLNHHGNVTNTAINRLTQSQWSAGLH